MRTWVAGLGCAVLLALGPAPSGATAVAESATQPLRIAGSTALAPVARALAAAYSQAHPDQPASLDLRGSGGGVHALAAGVAQVAMMDRPAWEAERRPFRQIVGREPVAIRIGVLGADKGGAAPPGAYVNARNGVAALSFEELARIFTTGGGAGDLVRWGQLDPASPYAARRIHLYGERDDGGFATNLRLDRFDGRQFAPAYEALDGSKAVIAALRDDPCGIAVLDRVPASDLQGLRRLTLAGAAGSTRAGEGPAQRDPLTPYLTLYLRPPAPGADAAVGFVRFALSPAGQQAMRAAAGSGGGLELLTPAEIGVEQARLDRLVADAR